MQKKLIKNWLNNIAVHCINDKYPNLKEETVKRLGKKSYKNA
jgi:hypothetical protein